MKLTATMMLTVDDLYHGPGGPDEDRHGGLRSYGWPVDTGGDEILDQLRRMTCGLHVCTPVEAIDPC